MKAARNSSNQSLKHESEVALTEQGRLEEAIGHYCETVRIKLSTMRRRTTTWGLHMAQKDYMIWLSKR